MTMEETSQRDLIKYRFQRAEETYREAVTLMKSGFNRGAINRLYYS